jgi:hypothetical protein
MDIERKQKSDHVNMHVLRRHATYMPGGCILSQHHDHLCLEVGLLEGILKPVNLLN